ncbi:MAG: energy transducer TonB [Bacteriovoracaceae bacterium]|nr:energy transducer TonB [Bacteriovoracaceae bacterium]
MDVTIKNNILNLTTLLFVSLIHVFVLWNQTGTSDYFKIAIKQSKVSGPALSIRLLSAKSQPKLKKPTKPATKKPAPFSGPQVITKSKIIGKVMPKYPWRSKVLQEEGKVVILTNINKFGEIESAKIYKSSGYTRLDNAALDSIQKSSFTPAYRANMATSSVQKIDVIFKLTSTQ